MFAHVSLCGYARCQMMEAFFLSQSVAKPPITQESEALPLIYSNSLGFGELRKGRNYTILIIKCQRVIGASRIAGIAAFLQTKASFLEACMTCCPAVVRTR